jgi:transcriptional regulator with XRE-family HTH domain
MFVNNLKTLIEDYKANNRREDGSRFTQNDIASMAEVDPATLSRYINNQINSVNLEVWQKLSDFFGVPGEQIFRVIPNAPDEPTDKKQRNS